MYGLTTHWPRTMALVLALMLGGLLSRPAVGSECVILLHGLARSAASMEDLAAAFTDAGYLVANVDYPSREHPIETLSTLAVEPGLGLCAEGQAQTIHFVTHSLGGILVRHYLSAHRVPALGRVVMLAPPNQGSEVVDVFGDLPGFHLLNGPAGDQLGTGADGVPRQLGAVDYPTGIIAGTRSINLILSTALPDPDDGKVSVAATRVDGMTDFLTLPVSHPFIMSDPDAITQTLRFIQIGRFMHSPE